VLSVRVMPCLLKRHGALVKTVKFKNFTYIGDPVNTIQIFNNLEVDELVLLDIMATKENQKPDFTLIKNIASECFMPLAYGGGIRDISDMKKIFNLGVEKIVICSYAVENPLFIKKASEIFGSQSVVVSIDVKKNFWGKYEVFSHSGTKSTKIDPALFAKKMGEIGAGEIFLNSIDRDGTFQGYDLDLIKKTTAVINIPLIACGGAGEYRDLNKPIKAGAQAVAAGSLFVYQRKNTESVLINFPTSQELNSILGEKRC